MLATWRLSLYPLRSIFLKSGAEAPSQTLPERLFLVRTDVVAVGRVTTQGAHYGKRKNFLFQKLVQVILNCSIPSHRYASLCVGGGVQALRFGKIWS